MAKRRRLRIRSQGAALLLGAVLLLGSAWSFDQAFEARGRTRPMIVRYATP